MKCSPSWIHPIWSSYWLQFLQNCFNIYVCTTRSVLQIVMLIALKWATMGGSSLRLPVSSQAFFHRLQLWPKTCSCGGSPWPTASFKPHAQLHLELLHGLRIEICSTWCPMSCRKTLCSTKSFPLGYRGTSAPYIEHPLPCSSIDLGVCKEGF